MDMHGITTFIRCRNVLIMSITRHIEAFCFRTVSSAPQGHEGGSFLTTMLTIASHNGDR